MPLFMYMELEKRISTHLEELFERELTGLFTVDIESGPAGVSVYIDGDEGVSIDQCQQVNRHLQRVLEEDEDFFTRYSLEVSSPGVDRPLKMWRQYQKHTGRTLEVKLTNGTVHEGRLKDMAATGIILEVTRKKTRETLEIPFESIKESFVKISFK